MTLVYFAWVRQKIGKNEERLALPEGVATVQALAGHLAARGGVYADAFADLAKLRAAVNREHVAFDAQVTDGDEVAFFPPVTGG
jgi:molybdopterin synthase sulfur carrier subunit